MGRAGFRGHGHSRPPGRAGRPDPGRQRQNDGPVEPNPAATHAGPELPVGFLHAVRVGGRESQFDAHPNPEALGLRVSQPIGDGGHERVADPMPLTKPDSVRLAERQPQGIRLAIA